MRDFTICIGTTFVFGRDAETKVGETNWAQKGVSACSSIMMADISGNQRLADAVRRRTGRHFLDGLGGVKPNPRLTLVREGIAIAKARNVDAVVAIGGGSVIDSAKAIALGAAGERDVWDYFTGKVPVDRYPSRRGGTDVPSIGQRIQPGRRHQQ